MIPDEQNKEFPTIPPREHLRMDELLRIHNDGNILSKLLALEMENQRLLDLTQAQARQLEQLKTEIQLRVNAKTEDSQKQTDILKLDYQCLSARYSDLMRAYSAKISLQRHLSISHSLIIADLVLRLATALEFSWQEINDFYCAALLLDLGKHNFPSVLLLSCEDNMTQEELAIYRQHPRMGALSLMAIPELRVSAMLIQQHMENVDGSGYPAQLKGVQIARGARVIRVARDFIGYQSGTILTNCLTAKQSFSHMEAHAGKRYDTFILNALEPLVDEFSLTCLRRNEARAEARKLRPGMILARDIVTCHGIRLISKGITLDSSLINNLIEFETLSSNRLEVFVHDAEQGIVLP